MCSSSRSCQYADLADTSFDRWPAVTVSVGRHETMLIDGHPCRPAELRGRTVRLIAESGAVYQELPRHP
jgi:hypothetical protein